MSPTTMNDTAMGPGIAPLTARQKWINLLKTSLVPLALLNLYLMPFDLRFLKLYEHIETPVDSWIFVTTILTLAVYSHPTGKHTTRTGEILFFTPLLFIFFGSRWYDWFVNYPPSTTNGTEIAWPVWSPQYWVRPGKITGKMLPAAVLSAFANNLALELLVSGKFAMRNMVPALIVSTRTRRIVVNVCAAWIIFMLKTTALEYPLTFDSPDLYSEGKLPWWTEIYQSWIQFANPLAPHSKFGWGKLMKYNSAVALLIPFFFTIRGGGVFYMFNLHTWKSNIIMEPILPTMLKTEPFMARFVWRKTNQVIGIELTTRKEGKVQEEYSLATAQDEKGHPSTQPDWPLPYPYGPINIAHLGLYLGQFTAAIFDLPYTVGWTAST